MLLCLGPGGVLAQSVPPSLLQVPTDRLRPPGPLDTQPRSRPEAPDLGPSEPAPPGAQAALVTLRRILLDGATRLDPAVLEAETAPLLNQPVPVSALFELAARLERRYRADGFILAQVTVPPQRIEDGVARLSVTEGYIEAVRLVGEVGPAIEQARRYLEVVTETRPLDLATLERALLLVEDIPGFSAQGLLRPGLEPGAAELVVELRRKPIDLGVALDNRASSFQGQEQALVSLGLNAQTRLAERVELLLLTSATEEQNFGQVAGEILPGRDGLRLRAYAGYGNSLPGGFLGAQDTDTRIAVAGLGLTYPVVKARREELNVGAYFDLYASRSDTNQDVPETHSDLRILRLGADGFRRDDWLGINTGLVRLSQGLEVWGATSAADQNANRIGARPDFRKANLEATRLQALYSTEGLALNLYGIVAAQWTDDVLPASEKFFLGGDRINRGFYPGQVTGDRGLAAGLELQANVRLMPDDRPPGEAVPVQLYLFYDAGWAWNIPENETTSAQRLRSAGAGIRLNIGQNVRVEFEMTNRLTRRPDGADADPVQVWDGFWRVVFTY